MNAPQADAKPVIGIVGGIGAGKSTVAAEFAALGCRLIDADRIGHELLARPDVLELVRMTWGDSVIGPDGQVSRAALGELVFSSPDELEALNAILHPRIGRLIQAEIDQARADPAAAGAVLDAAVMFEAGWDRFCTHRVYVSAPAQLRQARVARSRHWTADQWRSREKSQISLDTKVTRCEYTIDNQSDASHLREQVRVLFLRIRQED